MIHINCDVGEGIDNEEILMPYLNACNIACGGHAGDVETMHEVVALAKKYQVEIGAHPSYPDLENFGRVSMELPETELINTIQEQIANLEVVVKLHDVNINHIKPHGALYNDVAKSEEKAKAFLKAISEYKDRYKLFVPYNSAIEKLAIKQNFEVVYEAFADRNYNDDLTLVSRTKSSAILTKIDAIISHISTLQNEQKVQTISGEKTTLKSDTFCVHSDTKNAVEIVQQLYTHFNTERVTVQPKFPTFTRYGNNGLLLTWEAEMTQKVLYSVLEYQEKITNFRLKLILDVIQSNNSLLIIYNFNKIDFITLQHLLERLFLLLSDTIQLPKQYCWDIPVCYDAQFGIDLDEITQKNKLSTKEIIQLHTAPTYQVFSIGFLPGFLYLGGLDKRLHIDRKSTPRLKVKKGAVGIGGMQTGIYPKTSPGGWQIIGNSPLNFFDVSKEKPCFAKAGDFIKFTAISLEEYHEIANAVTNGTYTVKSTVC
ncbi:KipI family sensor histidine kinase inhibitor [Kordia periserrulae]|uniref:KipI family sensor histidine kinase inhibitor n=1 Tax=Kordia periserrulae TaxID=701523 RepID=A0A2T6BZ90_9FLAO|nr:5-oxoprolinase subunit PxpB [Kordia periserrulae]PTX61390.1 KipI family sensor histidine kinase inhibitor [Kordia periserrulae]